ncbi:RNA 2'-phosphotransferase [Paenibacillus albidus]|uniref:RNA 2'-phosphotransferase n=1 Tax=Paenibacillus albidus TaxID=2041023 RepID=UPI001BEAF3A3|nr:RNA 2'-phosphotransferase [Paenibacillus albidus]MBT2288353.1 RNA 2'-phosphotransferase [Paenibacillus albidus]
MISRAAEVSLSKYMTLLLRHQPERQGLVLDPEDGSCTLEELLEVITAAPKWSKVTEADLRQVTANSDKQRFEIEGGRIKARYGHSHTKVAYTPGTQPPVLIHGTHQGVLPAIMDEGLRPMGRRYVHLSEGVHFAGLAGSRRGKLVLLSVDTVEAARLGVSFYYAGNEVWLADTVPSGCLAVYEP